MLHHYSRAGPRATWKISHPLLFPALASRTALLCDRLMNTSARALGVDPGAARIGLALADDLGCMAHPLRTLRAGTEAENAREIAAAAAEKESPVIILGLPRNMNGTYGPAAEKSRALAELLRPLTTAQVILWDERLTTAAATRRLQEAGRNSRDQRGVIDQAAAVQILQDWIDAQVL
jgi:putative Holliday junction resolvase